MRLSDFKGEKGIEVLGKLLLPVTNMIGNPKNFNDIKSGNILLQAGAFLRNNPKDVLELLAIMEDKDPSTFECNAQEVLKKILGLFDDPELLQLFGLQGETKTSSGSATMITKVEK